MLNLPALLDASQFDGLAITKTPAGFSVTLYSDALGWTPEIVRPTPAEALLVALMPPCPVPLP